MRHLAIAAAAIGPSHLESGRPCEDSYAGRQSADGAWTSAVVCDGCSSVAHARDGAIFISEYIADELVQLAPDLDRDGPGEWIIDRVVMIVANLRNEMRREYGKDISQRAATVVGAMVSRKAGFIVHIGDGIASAFSLSDSASDLTLEPVAQSDPENGEYANETFYVTEPNWIRHLRITPVLAPDFLILCTDGAQALYYDNNEPRSDNITFLLNQLFATGENNASECLDKILADAAAGKLSHDDKTVFLLARDEAWQRIPNIVPKPAAKPPSPKPTTLLVPSAPLPRTVLRPEEPGAPRASATPVFAQRTSPVSSTPPRRRRSGAYQSFIFGLTLALGLGVTGIAGFLLYDWLFGGGSGGNNWPLARVPFEAEKPIPGVPAQSAPGASPSMGPNAPPRDGSNRGESRSPAKHPLPAGAPVTPTDNPSLSIQMLPSGTPVPAPHESR